LVADDQMATFGSTDKLENLSERRELSDAAKALLADKAFGHAVLSLRKRWFGELMDQAHAGVKQDEVAARLRALEGLSTELALLLTDFREAQRSQRHAS
jgi:hypothetical protein